MTHFQDAVPHLPTTTPIPYHHQALEYYEDNKGKIKKCNGSGEDASCADQWGPTHRSVDDHMWYLGGYMGCGNVISLGKIDEYDQLNADLLVDDEELALIAMLFQ